MTRTGAAILLLAALLALPAYAAAAYEAGSSLEADAPVVLQGPRVDALTKEGVAGFVSDAPRQTPVFTLQAATLQTRAATIQPPCTDQPPACTPIPMGPQDEEETRTLKDATVTLVKVLGASKIVATNDATAYGASDFAGEGGRLIATVNTLTTSPRYTASARTQYLSPYDAGWSERDPAGARTDDIYTLPAKGAQVVSEGGGALAGTGNLQVLLQGFSVRVRGTDEDGKPVDETYDLPAPAGTRDPVRFLDLQATDARFQVVSLAPLLMHGVSVVDAEGGAAFKAATGEVVVDGRRTPYEREDVTLKAPVSLTLTKVVDGSPLRMAFTISSVLAIANAVPPPPEEEPADTAALVAAGAAGAGGMGLLAAVAYFWPRLKFATTLLFLPLYSRIERTAVLEHEKRDEIYGLIRATPGIHAHEIGEKAQIGWGTTVYHLKLLEQHSLIVSQKSGRYKRFFVNTGEFTKKKDAYGALRNETAKAVAQHIVDHPGVTQKELCAALGIQPSLASWHVEKLEGVELVKRVKDGRMVRYFAGPAWSQLNVRMDPRGGAEGVAET